MANIGMIAPPAMIEISSIDVGDRHRRHMGDIAALAESIADIGLLHPIVIRPDGVLIAGERRLRAFRHLKRTMISATVIDTDRVLRGEYAENFFRKTFAPSEIVAIAKALLEDAKASAKERMIAAHASPEKFSELDDPSRALDHVAKAVGVSRPTITKALEICDAADGDPTRFADLRDEMDETGRVDGAYKKFKKRKRAHYVAETAKGVPKATSRYRLVHGSVGKLTKEPAGTVDLIITDPPYPEEFLPLFGELARGAAHVLKPGGLLVCMSGQSWLPRVFVELAGSSLEYLWTLAYLTPGGQATQVFPRKVNTFWKPVIVYCQGSYEGEWYGDVTRSDVNDNDKSHHHWGQSVSGMRDLMQRFVVPGNLVIDPFLGGGTTAIVALELGASFLGFDISQDAIDATRARLADVT
jgi:DNA methylase/ParB/Sulfiredoxin domain